MGGTKTTTRAPSSIFVKGTLEGSLKSNMKSENFSKKARALLFCRTCKIFQEFLIVRRKDRKNLCYSGLGHSGLGNFNASVVIWNESLGKTTKEVLHEDSGIVWILW